MHANSQKVIRQAQILKELGQFCSSGSTIAAALAAWCYPEGEYARPQESDLIAMNGIRLYSSNQDHNGHWVTSGWSDSPTEEWLFPDGSRMIVSASHAGVANRPAPVMLMRSTEGDRILRLPKSQMHDFMQGNAKVHQRAYKNLHQWLLPRMGWVVVR